MKQSKLIFISIILLQLLISCNSGKNTENIISVTIEPQRYFAERIAGDKFKINTVVPAGQNPEAFDPALQQMVNIGKSIAYFRIGHIGFEQAWMENIRQNNPQLAIFDLSEGIDLIIHDEGACDHIHHDHLDHHHDHHHHGGIDPHIWSSISGARIVAVNTLNALINLDPENASYYWTNYNKLLEEIDETEIMIKSLLSPIEGKAFIIYHPALTYFALENNLTQLTIEMEGKEPSPAQLKELIEMARKSGANTVFVQLEFDSKNAEIIARETGCRLVSINPLAYDWRDEMLQIANALVE